MDHGKGESEIDSALVILNAQMLPPGLPRLDAF